MSLPECQPPKKFIGDQPIGEENNYFKTKSNNIHVLVPLTAPQKDHPFGETTNNKYTAASHKSLCLTKETTAKYQHSYDSLDTNKNIMQTLSCQTDASLQPVQSSDDIQFPSIAVREKYQHLIHFLKKSTSDICSGNAVRTTCRRVSGDIVGLYCGKIVDDPTDYNDTYLMSFTVNRKIVIVDGAPPTVLDKHDFRITSLANDYIWDSEKNNIIALNDGRLQAIKTIPQDSELFLDYGPDYNWNLYIINVLIPNFCYQLQLAIMYLKVANQQQHVDEIISIVNS